MRGQLAPDYPRTEWRIFDEKYHIAGTIDLLVKTNQGYDMYDWKRSKRVVDRDTGKISEMNWGNYGLGELSEIPDTPFNRYSIQQNLYRYILEENYGIKISNMYIVVFHPLNERFYKLLIEGMPKETNYILESLRMQ